MKCTRIHADAAGESRLEEIDIGLDRAVFAPPTPPMDLSVPFEATRVVFVSLPVGWQGERHNAPRRQFFLQFSGMIELEVADGRRVRTGPGSVTLLEDTQGSGHMTRVLGDEPATGAFVQFPD